MPAADELTITAPFSGTVIAIAHGPDEAGRAGAAVVVLEAMKMEHEVVADADGYVDRIDVAVGDTVDEGQRLAVLRPGATRPGTALRPRRSISTRSATTSPPCASATR